MILPPPTSTLFPYTTLFRSRSEAGRDRADDVAFLEAYARILGEGEIRLLAFSESPWTPTPTAFPVREIGRASCRGRLLQCEPPVRLRAVAAAQTLVRNRLAV